MMDISLRNLKLVNVIVKEDSVTKAAEKLFLSQPALSHQLKKLEAEIGLKIFNRFNKKLILTETGKIIFNASEKLLPSINLLNAELEGIKRGEKKKIRLTTECYTCYHWLPKVVQKFKGEHPEINVEINIEATQDPIQFLNKGEIDMAIVSNKSATSIIHFEPLITDEMVVILSKENDLVDLDELSLSDLQNQNLILYDLPEEKNYVLTKILNNDLDKVKSIQKVQLTEAIIELVSANLGISVMARWAVTPFLQNKQLKLLPLKEKQGEREWFIASLNQVSKMEKQFIAQVKTNFAADDF
ncbi:LysR family transcriptional regulator [Flammeovirga pectinis]|uniref:LysR family transcriptional regulator n=1 Tax=Flammeovirga pectinis TaxID=2494373 RepID=A0A3S9NZ71_9BACT|nr:LysR family transcriptional regulator [Flammeovirga pectinis]AZQ61146.1 LysR family transcriptional regulator [Flammeovirga pectinis]